MPVGSRQRRFGFISDRSRLICQKMRRPARESDAVSKPVTASTETDSGAGQVAVAFFCRACPPPGAFATLRPMPISWNEIRHNAIKFSRDWTGARSERAEKQTFWNEFFHVFGVSRRAVASFEDPVKKISGDYGYIDLFWPRIVLVEHKSSGKDLGKAESQAFRYIQDLEREGRHQEIPRYVIVSDFNRVALHDLEPEDQKGLPLFDNRRVATIQFPLAEFHKCVHAFAFIPGYKQHKFEEQDPIN